jgi:hypothetical protein
MNEPNSFENWIFSEELSDNRYEMRFSNLLNIDFQGLRAKLDALKREDFSCLAPRGLLHSSVFELWCFLLKETASNENTFLLDDLQALWFFKYPERISTSRNPFVRVCDKLCFPWNVNGNHWITVQIDRKEKEIEIFDSLSGSHMNLFSFFARFMNNVEPGLCAPAKWKFVCRANSEQEKGSNDCGIFALFFITKCYLQDDSMSINPKSTTSIRSGIKQIFQSIRTTNHATPVTTSVASQSFSANFTSTTTKNIAFQPCADVATKITMNQALTNNQARILHQKYSVVVREMEVLCQVIRLWMPSKSVDRMRSFLRGYVSTYGLTKFGSGQRASKEKNDEYSTTGEETCSVRFSPQNLTAFPTSTLSD